MNRLTKRNSKGIAYMAIADTLPKSEQEIEGSKTILEELYAMFQKLADYEDREEKTKCVACGGSGHYKDGKCGACEGTGKELENE